MGRALQSVGRVVCAGGGGGGGVLRQRAGRRRVLIVVAGALICLYSVAVLWHVMNAPDIGLCCPFSTKILRVYPGYAPAGGARPVEGDWVVELYGRPVDWQHFLRRLDELPGQPVQELAAAA